jgi:hypothetical protein
MALTTPKTEAEIKKPLGWLKWSFLVLALINFLIVFAFYQTRPVFEIKLGQPGDDWYLEKFYAPESNAASTYRWSQAQSKIVLPEVGSPFEIKLQAVAYRPEGSPPATLTLNWSKPALSQSFTGTSAETEYTLQGGTKPYLNTGRGTLTLNSDTFHPSKTDDRQLGLLVQKVSIQAYPNRAGLVLPPLLPWLSLGAGLLALQLWLVVILNHLKLLARKPLFWLSTGAVPLVLLVTGLLLPNVMLENAFSLGLGLIFLATGSWFLLRYREKVVVWLGLFAALATIGVLYGWFRYATPLMLYLGLSILILFLNPRFEKLRFNLLFIGTSSIFAWWGLLQDRAFRTIDAEGHHYFWLNELDLMIKEGQFYPRWAPHFAYQHGSAVFNFYAPLSRYLGEIFVLLNLTPAFAVHAMLIAIGVASGVSAYFLARKFLGGLGAVVCAFAFIYHPYHLAETYQRGDIAEATVFPFFPLVLLAATSFVRLDRANRIYMMILGGTAYAFLICAHLLGAFFFTVYLLGFYFLFHLLRYFIKEQRANGGQAWKRLGQRVGWLALTLGFGVGLAAFFVLPAFFEINDVRLNDKIRIDADYGFLDFQHNQWWQWIPLIGQPTTTDREVINLAWVGSVPLVLAIAGLVTGLLWRSKGAEGESKERRWQLIGLGLVLAVLLLMQFKATLPFWENFPYMVYIQFSWRLMMYVSLVVSLLIGVLVEQTNFALSSKLFPRFGGSTPWFAKAVSRQEDESNLPLRNSNALQPSEWPKIPLVKAGLLGILALVLIYTGQGRVSLNPYDPSFTGRYSLSSLIQHWGELYYLPRWSTYVDTIGANPAAYAQPYVERNGQRQDDPVSYARTSPTSYRLTADLKAPGTLIMPVYYFDGWKLTVNGQPAALSYNQPFGFSLTTLPAGKQELELRFEDTPIRSLGFGLTVLCLVSIPLLVIWQRRRRKNLSIPGQILLK